MSSQLETSSTAKFNLFAKQPGTYSRQRFPLGSSPPLGAASLETAEVDCQPRSPGDISWETAEHCSELPAVEWRLCLLSQTLLAAGADPIMSYV